MLPAASRAGLFWVAFAALAVVMLARPLSAIDAAVIDPAPDERRPGGLLLGAAFIASLGVLVASALVTRIFVVEAYKIPAGSMVPTLRTGDHAFVDKRATAFHRGRAIVFQFPENKAQDFVKRVIAIGGDVLEMRDGHPWINGWEVPHCLVGHASLPRGDDEPGTFNGDVFVEFLDGEAYLTLVDPKALAFVQRPWTVAPGEAFVLGDNRDKSHDSRLWFDGRGGGVPSELVRGEPFVVWLSTRDDGVHWGHVLTPEALPRELSSLKPLLERCLATRPTREATTPPKH